MSKPEFTAFLTRAFSLAAKFSRDGSIHFLCIDFRHLREMFDAGEAAYTELKNVCVWDKRTAGMGSGHTLGMQKRWLPPRPEP